MKSDELQKIIKAAELVNSNLSVKEVLNNIVKVAVELTNADRGTLYLLDAEKNELWSLIAVGVETQEIRLKIGHGLAGYVAKSGETINIENAQDDSRFNSEYDLLSGYKTQSVICFPIRDSKHEIIGVLQLINNQFGKFSQRDEDFLNALSIHSAIAINNALMHQEQVIINQKLELAKQEAEKFEMLKNHFLLQMSHEIRTPFNIILGSIEVLKNEKLFLKSNEMKEIFEMLEHGSNRIIRTVDEIMEMSKVRSGNYEIHIEKIKLEEDILSHVINSYKLNAEMKGLQFFFEKTTDLNEVQCDKFMTYQIFQEIIDNALKFTTHGSVYVKQFKNEEDKLCVSISDTGIGISPDYLEHIFEPFSQEDTGYSRKFEGNGLALALIKKYAELNNLSISVKSEKNVGSEFLVAFL
ncbi:MAG: GAF domain-containing sensor histidine kinase [Ignavibacteriales bacterium]|nr:GAF domain-containing sensor histidine kinase [Ignavibacteriales bacterium]